jgi:hypothetical protein
MAVDSRHLMSGSKRPSTSSLRRFICSRPYVPVAEIRRRFGLDEADSIFCLELDGRQAFVGLPEREGQKLQDLLNRQEIGMELSVEVNAPVVVGIYPIRIARYLFETNTNGHPGARANEHFANGHGNGNRPDSSVHPSTDGSPLPHSPSPAR